MRWLILAITLFGVLALGACGGSGNTDGLALSGSSVAQASGYIVVFKPGVAPSAVQGLAAQLASAPTYTYDSALTGFAGLLSPAELARLRSDARVDFIEPDRSVTAYGYKEASFAQVLPWGVGRIDAELNANKGTGVAVAVIDTGIDLTHPDLAHAVAGANFIHQGQSPNDDNGHGTHVAGIIAAANNNFGYVGVAPDATVVAVKVLDSTGAGTLSGVIAGINWVSANHTAFHIKVANLSLGAPGFSQALYNAIQGATSAGVTFVVAAGNSHANAAGFSPSGFDNVITVSALNPNNTFASYSNYGNVIDLIAPGTNIPSLYKNHGYATLSGTSMASPHVAGSAALWLKDHPDDTFSAVRSALISRGQAGNWAGDPDGVHEKLVFARYL
jgi:subtilisin